MEKKNRPSQIEALSGLPEGYLQRFGGIARLCGAEALAKLFRAKVTVVGIGGVGSWVVESLARTGVGELVLIDLDDVCITNVNRQLPALDGTIGRPKVAVLADRVLAINPDCRLTAVAEFVTTQNLATLLTTKSGVVVDCIDRAKLKAEMILHCLAESIPVITVGGAGGRIDPLAVQLEDLSKTSGDPLLKQVRKAVRSALGIRGEKVRKLRVPCVFSAEPLRYPQADGSCGLVPEPGGNLRMDCASGFGAVTHVTGVFGFAAAAAAVDAVLAGGE